MEKPMHQIVLGRPFMGSCLLSSWIKIVKRKKVHFACWIILRYSDSVTESDNCWISVEDPKPVRTVPS